MEEKLNTISKKYSPFNLEQFKNWLRDMKEKGEIKYFEVYVDDFKVVSKTDNPDNFDSHEQFVDDETEKVRVLVFNTEKSNRYKQHVFKLKDSSQSLNGIEVEKKIEDGINKGLKAMEEKFLCDQVKKELEDTKFKLKESEDWNEKLEGIIEETKKKLEDAKGMSDFTGIIKDLALPHILGKKAEDKSSLSGNETPKEEASFRMKSSEENALSEDDKFFLEFGSKMKTTFIKEEFDMIMDIIGEFVKDKANIKPVTEFLNINQIKK
jgi:hypothetical protein